MGVNFGEIERYINSLFIPKTQIQSDSKNYVILYAGKPTCTKGEPKTDIYVRLKLNDDSNRQFELKISIKKSNADFLENKINEERAKALLGDSWKDIIIKSTSNIKSSFNNKNLIFKEKHGRTNKGSITLGWKFELLNKTGGDLSGKLQLSPKQVLDIYTGTNLPDEKKNAMVNGKVIKNSGIANCILIVDDINSFKCAQDVVNALIRIDSYINRNPDIYFACKALNYRTFENKFDGNRPLSVFVDWSIVNNRLTPKIVFNNPLVTKGNLVANKLKNSLNILGISTTDDITSNNVSSLNYVYDK